MRAAFLIGFPAVQAQGRNARLTDASRAGQVLRSRRARHASIRSLEELTGLTSELREIDEYVEREDFEDWNPWPAFLRGVAYQDYGHWELAVEYLTKAIDMGLGLPEIYFRRARVRLSMNSPTEALLDFHRGDNILSEAVGNPHHVVHWYQENFAHLMPPVYGPPAIFQHTVTFYVLGDFAAAQGMVVHHRHSSDALITERLWHSALLLLMGGDISAYAETSEATNSSWLGAMWNYLMHPSEETFLIAKEKVDGIHTDSEDSQQARLLLPVLAHSRGMSHLAEDRLQELVAQSPDRVRSFEHAAAQAMLTQRSWERPGATKS